MELQKISTTHNFDEKFLWNSKQSSKKIKKLKKRTKEPKKDDVGDSAETKKRNQRYMNVLNDLSRLRDHYYTIYLAKLDDKVKEQRKQHKAKEEKVRRAILEKEMKNVKKSHQNIYRLPKVQLNSNTDYLRQVPKSHYYHLVAVEELMKSRGLLKRKFEIDEFWLQAKNDQNFWTHPIPDSMSPNRLTEHMLSRYNSLAIDSKSDPNIQSKHNINELKPLPGINKKLLNASDIPSHERCDSPPLVFPKKPKFPKLHSFNTNLLLKPNFEYLETASSIANRDKDEAFQITPKRSKRKIHHHMKKDAYEVAVVNRAVMGRLMKKHAVSVDALKPISEINEIWCSQSDSSSYSKKTNNFKNISVSHHRVNTKEQKPSYEEKTFEEKQILPLSAEKTADNYESKKEPLSMEMMMSSEIVSVKNAKNKKLFWINYTTANDNTEIF